MESNHENQTTNKDVQEFTSGLRFSSDGSLLVKLKLPMFKEREDEEDEIDLKEQTHFCSECNKSFSSGKALGGHMSSAHVQANKGYNLKKLKSYQATKFDKLRKLESIGLNSNRSSSVLTGFDRKITCTLCGKDFPSKKSLFGHMRCHPEREWRGMAPPSEIKNSLSLIVSDVEPEEADQEPEDKEGHQVYSAPMVTPVVDLTESLNKGWSLKDRRGRQGTKSAIVSAPKVLISEEEKEELYDVCNQLVNLVKSVPEKSCLSDKRDVEEAEAKDEEVSRGFQLKRQRVEAYPDKDRRISPVMERKFDARVSTEAHTRSKVDKGKRKAILDAEICENIELSKKIDDSYSSDTESDSELLNRKYNERIKGNMMVESKRRKQKMKPINSSFGDVSPMTVATPGKYKCTACDKCFTTYQALGGHRSSHNKFKISILNTIDEVPSSPVGDSNNQARLGNQSEGTKESDDQASGGSKVVEGTHQCSICKKNFPTGQALGGHKRTHWTGPLEVASSSQVPSPEEATRTIYKTMEFDLNEIPNMKD